MIKSGECVEGWENRADDEEFYQLWIGLQRLFWIDHPVDHGFCVFARNN